MLIAIDGPACTGKSSVAEGVARELGFDHLNTGAMYRAVALLFEREKIDYDDFDRGMACLAAIQLHEPGGQVRIDSEDVSDQLKNYSQQASLVGEHPHIRAYLISLQRRYSEGRKLVTEGRDQGTVVFPHAQLKVFLTASYESRVLRGRDRFPGWNEAQIIEELRIRDERDAKRKYGALKIPEGVTPLDTTHLTKEQVIASILQQYREITETGH